MQRFTLFGSNEINIEAKSTLNLLIEEVRFLRSNKNLSWLIRTIRSSIRSMYSK
jgi:hypothetical protein